MKDFFVIIHMFIDCILLYILFVRKQSIHVHVHNDINSDTVNIEKATINSDKPLINKTNQQ